MKTIDAKYVIHSIERDSYRRANELNLVRNSLGRRKDLTNPERIELLKTVLDMRDGVRELLWAVDDMDNFIDQEYSDRNDIGE